MEDAFASSIFRDAGLNSTRSNFYRGIFASILALAGSPCLQAEDLRWSGTLGVSLVDFEYREFEDSGRLLDQETGQFPELNLGLKLDTGNWFLAAELRYLEDTADYIAFPASGPPLESTTREEITDLTLLLGLQRDLADAVSVAMYGGLGLRHWGRDIRSIASASGLDEKYRWGYVLIGISPATNLGPRDRLAADLQLRQAFDASLDVDFKNINYDPARLQLDNGIGLRFALNWTRRINEELEFILGPFVDLWEFDRSDDADLRQDNIIIGSLYEPASETTVYGIRFLLTSRF